MNIQYSYKIGFFDGEILKSAIWINGATDSIQAEQTALKMCNNQYNVIILEKE